MDAGKIYCFKCHREIVGVYYNFGIHHYHANCFVCEKCGENLAHGFLSSKAHMLCEKCFVDTNARKMRKCPLCKQPVGVGKYVTAMDKDWHPDCFVCALCKKHLIEVFYDILEKPYCKDCMELLYQKAKQEQDSNVDPSVTKEVVAKQQALKSAVMQDAHTAASKVASKADKADTKYDFASEIKANKKAAADEAKKKPAEAKGHSKDKSDKSKAKSKTESESSAQTESTQDETED